MSQGTAGAAAGPTPEIDLARVFRVIRAHKFIVLAWLLSGAGAALIAAFLMPPYYRATALLSPSNDNQSGPLAATLGSLGSFASLAGFNIGANPVNPSDAAQAVLLSRRFSDHFIVEHKLLPVLFSRKWDAKKGQWKVAKDDEPDLEDGFEKFDDLRGVNTDKKTGLISVWIDMKDPRLAAQLVNQAVAELNSEMAARAEQKATAYVEYLQNQLESASVVETRAAIGRLMETQINQRMLAKASPDYAFEVVEQAQPPDLDDPVKPKKILMGIAGAFFGLLTGVIVALRVDRRRADGSDAIKARGFAG